MQRWKRLRSGHHVSTLRVFICIYVCRSDPDPHPDPEKSKKSYTEETSKKSYTEEKRSNKCYTEEWPYAAWPYAGHMRVY